MKGEADVADKEPLIVLVPIPCDELPPSGAQGAWLLGKTRPTCRGPPGLPCRDDDTPGCDVILDCVPLWLSLLLMSLLPLAAMAILWEPASDVSEWAMLWMVRPLSPCTP